MQAFSPIVKTLLADDNVAIYFLVKYDSTLFTSLPYAVSIEGMPGLNLYAPEVAGAGLLSIEPPRMSSSVDKTSYKITISDPSFEFRTRAMQGNVGSKIEVRFGFFNTKATAIVDSSGTSVPVGAPLLNFADTTVVYGGYASSQSYSIDFDGTAKFIVEGTSPFGALDNTKAHYTTKDFIKSRFNELEEDTAYERIYEGGVETRVKWGKK